jgi:anthranilate synthase component 1
MNIRPQADEFLAFAADHSVVPVWTEVLGDLETPVSAFLKLVDDGPGFLLESVENGERWSRFSFIGRDPVATLVLRGEALDIEGTLGAMVPTDQGILGALEALLDSHSSPDISDLPPLHGGIVGYLGYDVIREVEHLPDAPPNDHGMPDAVMSIIGSLAAFDHWRQRIYLIESVVTRDEAGHPLSEAELLAARDAAIDAVKTSAQRLAAPSEATVVEPPVPGERHEDVPSSMSNGRYLDAVVTAKEHILAGDIFQVVLAQRYDIELEADPFDVYRVLRQVNPSPYMYFIRHDEATLVGSSPEPMVQLRGDHIVSRPIAGTRKRGLDEEHDRRLAAELLEHPKERAEHVMLVDLARNDGGSVAEFGSVQPEEFMTLERYSHVMHLTSQVTGTIRPGLGPIDVLKATLPAGTVSGAPKVRAMEIIDELEPVRRGPYAGVVGYLDWSGNLDTAICIRTMFVRADGVTASLQAGAGIVADSDPEDEDLECRNKAAALLAAIPAARRMTATRRSQES